MNNGCFLFRVKSPSGISQILSIDPTLPIAQLKNKISELFSCPVDSFDLFSGFPPQRVECCEDTIIQSILKSNSALLINSKSSSTAIGALSSTAPRPTPKSTSSSNSSGTTGGNNIRSLSSPVTSSGLVASRRRTKISASSQEDIADHLIAAVGGSDNGNTATDKRSVVLRRVFKSAVQRQYKTTLSTARQAAGLSGLFTLAESANVRVLGASSEVRRIVVSFKAGLTSRTQHSETIDLIPKELIKAVLEEALSDTAGHGRELLKPENLSLASPRIFWSLIYFYGRDMQHTFATMFPECADWTWLDERKRELSEKAQINIDQQRERMRQRMSQQQERASRKRPKEQLIQSPVIDLSAADDSVTSDINSSAMNIETPQSRATKKTRVSVVERESPFTTPGMLSTSAGNNRFFDFVRSAGLARLHGLIHPTHFEQPLLKTLTRIDPVGASALTLANCLTDVSYRVSYDSLIERIADEVTTNKIIRASQYNGDDEEDSQQGEKTEEELDQSLIDEWIAVAQHEVYKMVWSFLCGGHRRLSRALIQAQVTSPALLSVWRMAPNALLDNLLTLDPHLGKVMIRRISLTHVPESTSSTRSKMGRNKTRATTVGNHEKERSENPEFCRLSTEVVRDMCGLAHGLLTLSETHWLEDICASELVDDDDEGAEDEVVNTEKHVIENTKEDSYSVPNENDGWLSTPTSHSLLGVRVRCYMDEGDTMDSATEVPLRWYEDGTMVGYLPATEDEPMALWRVCLDSVSDDPSLGLSVSETAAGSSCKVVMASEALRQQMAERVFHPSVQSTARCEDLEEHEVMAAASRFMNAWS